MVSGCDSITMSLPCLGLRRSAVGKPNRLFCHVTEPLSMGERDPWDRLLRIRQSAGQKVYLIFQPAALPRFLRAAAILAQSLDYRRFAGRDCGEQSGKIALLDCVPS